MAIKKIAIPQTLGKYIIFIGTILVVAGSMIIVSLLLTLIVNLIKKLW